MHAIKVLRSQEVKVIQRCVLYNRPTRKPAKGVIRRLNHQDVYDMALKASV